MGAITTRLRKAIGKKRGRRALYLPHKLRNCDVTKLRELQSQYADEAKQRLQDYQQYVTFAQLNGLEVNKDSTFASFSAQVLCSALKRSTCCTKLSNVVKTLDDVQRRGLDATTLPSKRKCLVMVEGLTAKDRAHHATDIEVLDELEDKICKSANTAARNFVAFMMLTGLRSDDVSHLTKEQVVWETDSLLVDVRFCKNRRRRSSRCNLVISRQHASLWRERLVKLLQHAMGTGHDRSTKKMALFECSKLAAVKYLKTLDAHLSGHSLRRSFINRAVEMCTKEGITDYTAVQTFTLHEDVRTIKSAYLAK